MTSHAAVPRAAAPRHPTLIPYTPGGSAPSRLALLAPQHTPRILTSCDASAWALDDEELRRDLFSWVNAPDDAAGAPSSPL